MKPALVVLIVAVAAASGALAFAYSGLANVAATSPHWAVTEWILSTTMRQAVKRHARQIAPAPSLGDEAHLADAADCYDAMCAACHGAPGSEPGIVGKGLNPKPPDLAKEVDEWTPEEIFWVTRHGIRMTGMPAFGLTHSDEELWEIVAFVRRLPRMSSAEYRRLVSAKSEDREHGSRAHECGHHHQPLRGAIP